MLGVREVDDTIAPPAPSSTRAPISSRLPLRPPPARGCSHSLFAPDRDHRAAEDLVHEAFVELISEIDEVGCRETSGLAHRAIANALASAGGQATG